MRLIKPALAHSLLPTDADGPAILELASFSWYLLIWIHEGRHFCCDGLLEGASVASFLSSSREDLLTFLSHVIQRPDGKSAPSHDEAAICKIHLVPKPQLFALSINGNGDDSILNGENGKGDGEKERGDRASEEKEEESVGQIRCGFCTKKSRNRFQTGLNHPKRRRELPRSNSGELARWMAREGRSSS